MNKNHCFLLKKNVLTCGNEKVNNATDIRVMLKKKLIQYCLFNHLHENRN